MSFEIPWKNVVQPDGSQVQSVCVSTKKAALIPPQLLSPGNASKTNAALLGHKMEVDGNGGAYSMHYNQRSRQIFKYENQKEKIIRKTHAQKRE